jgi:hypothetical protein
MVCPQIVGSANSLQIYKVAVNILNKQSQLTESVPSFTEQVDMYLGGAWFEFRLKHWPS